jgi:hypothetical protein
MNPFGRSSSKPSREETRRHRLLTYWLRACVLSSSPVWCSAWASEGVTPPLKAEVTWLLRSSAEPKAPETPHGTTGSMLQPDGGLLLLSGGGPELIIHRISRGGQLSTRTVRAPSLKGRYMTAHGDPKTGDIYFTGYANATLSIRRLQPDDTTTEVVSIVDDRIASIFYDQGGGDYFGNLADGFWLTNTQFKPRAAYVTQNKVTLLDLPASVASATIRAMVPAGADSQPSTLWLIDESGKLSRVDTRGQLLAQTSLEFTAPSKQEQMTESGPSLFASRSGGVIAKASTHHEWIVVSADGRVQWRQSLCTSAVSKDCFVQSYRQGFLGGIHHVAGDVDGSVVVGDAARVFRVAADGTRSLVYGVTKPCDSDTLAYRNKPPPHSFVPCYNDGFRASQLSAGRYLLASAEDQQQHLIELRLTQHMGQTQGTLLPYAVAPENIPIDLRVLMSNSLRDERLVRSSRYPTGIPLREVMHTSERLARGARWLSGPNPNQGHALLYALSGKQAASSVSIGPTKILTTLFTNGPPSYWLFDAATQRYRVDPVRIKVADGPSCIAEPGRSSVASRPANYIINDDHGRALMVDRASEALREIDEHLTARFVACLPADQPDVLVAARDLRGRLWLGGDGQWLVQRGHRLHPVVFAADDRVRSLLQLVPGLGQDMVALMNDGIAILRVAE